MIGVESTDGCMDIVLRRPERANALSPEMVESLTVAIDEAVERGVRYVMIRGEGKHFCSGFDLAPGEDGVLHLRFMQLERLLAKIAYAPFPIIACVNGAAIGAGADLVAACTFRVGTTGVTFRFPGPQFGVVLGTRRLTRLVGADSACRLLLLQEKVLAVDALKMGLLSQVVEVKSDLIAAGREIARRLALTDAETQASILRIVRSGNATEELGELCSSTSRPGLRDRLIEYSGVQHISQQ